MRRRAIGSFQGLALGLIALCALGGARSAAASSSDFPRPAKLKPAVEFWKRIFADYSEHQVVVHDAWYLGKVYEVLDFRPWYQDSETETEEFSTLRHAKVEEAKERVRAILLHLHSLGPDPDPSQLTDDERKVRALFSDVSEPDKYLAAVDRIHTQSGLRERFSRGIVEQSRYLDRMQSILAERGMPVELARLPLVESCFNVDAYSKVGAAGVWQFMPGTGRQYLRVANDVDERRDPIRATVAAAEHLGGDYEALGTWPLAITAYNHGRGGVAHGVEEVGSTDIGEIATRYHGRAFGFASRNFYAEFLAVLDVTSNVERHFGDLPTYPPLDAMEVEIERPIHLAAAARRIGVSTEDLLVLNPALQPSIARGSACMPRGYVLRVPRDAGGSLDQIASALRAGGEAAPVRVASARMARSASSSRSSSSSARRGSSAVVIASAKKSSVAKSPGAEKAVAQAVTVHKVTAGQTLVEIARRYGTTVALIQGLNNLHQVKGIQPGQRIKVPRGST